MSWPSSVPSQVMLQFGWFDLKSVWGVGFCVFLRDPVTRKPRVPEFGEACEITAPAQHAIHFPHVGTTRTWTAGFSLWFHLPVHHVGYMGADPKVLRMG